MYDFNFYIGRPKQLPDEAYWRAVENSIKVESQEARGKGCSSGFQETGEGSI
jgi:hypothetical protein